MLRHWHQLHMMDSFCLSRLIVSLASLTSCTRTIEAPLSSAIVLSTVVPFSAKFRSRVQRFPDHRFSG